MTLDEDLIRDLNRSVMPLLKLLNDDEHALALESTREVLGRAILQFRKYEKESKLESELLGCMVAFQLAEADVHIHSGNIQAAIACYQFGAVAWPTDSSFPSRIAIILAALNDLKAEVWVELALDLASNSESDFEWMSKLSASAMLASKGNSAAAVAELPTDFFGISIPLQSKMASLFSNLQHGMPLGWSKADFKQWALLDLASCWKL